MKRPHFIFKVEKGVATVDPESLIDFVGYTDHLEAENKELKEYVTHSFICHTKNNLPTCTCGLDKLLKK